MNSGPAVRVVTLVRVVAGTIGGGGAGATGQAPGRGVGLLRCSEEESRHRDFGENEQDEREEADHHDGRWSGHHQILRGRVSHQAATASTGKRAISNPWVHIPGN